MTPFEKAFSQARKAGKAEFTFKGKKYNTKLKEEVGGGAVRPKKNPNRAPVVDSTPPAPPTPPAAIRPMKATTKEKSPTTRPKARPTGAEYGKMMSKMGHKAAKLGKK